MAQSALVKTRVDEDVQTSAAVIPKKLLAHEDYTVGWICPLEVEQIAAMEMLDEEHERLPQVSTDHNVYNLGNIAGHNVVIAGLHQPGNNPAAAVVTQMRMTFPNLRFGLLVGIGGGVPVKTDHGMIRLGDVVVSKPAGGHSGAVQYDHGKARVGHFERTGALAPPPAVLLNAAQDLAAKRARSRTDPINDNIKRIDTSIRGLRKYKHPGAAKDHLYEADYIHPTLGLSCDECGCDPSKRVQRPIDDDDDESYIVVHRGTIASGEAVVKDAKLRDKLAEEHGLLCFEMEAAGALADFPCIVIRGISDYCDSHKNDQWHGYAAVAAAAYGRELFFHMPVEQVRRYISDAAEKIINRMTLRHKNKDHQEILEWLSPTNFPAQQNGIISRRQEGTAQWFLDSVEFREWLHGPDKTLFCPGIPGAGKTMTAAVVIDHLYQTTQNDIGIAYLFCSYKAEVDQTAPNLFAAILKQLVRSRPDIAAPIYDQHSKRGTKPSLDELTQALLSACSSYSTVYVVVDALDECPNTNGVRRQLIGKLRSLQASRIVRVLCTSRFITDVMQEFQSSPKLEVRASEDDVRRYIAGQLPRLCIPINDQLGRDIEYKVVEAVDGMFLLARLHVDMLIDQTTPKQVRATLAKLRKGFEALNLAYKDALHRIDGQSKNHSRLAKQALCWISFAQRPITTNELCHALAIEPGESALDRDNLTDPGVILSVCAGLVEVDNESGIIRLVHYTTQEYLEHVRLTWNPIVQQEIAVACLTYLSFDAFKSGSCPSDENFEQKCAENLFLNYSARHWSEHVQPVQHSTLVSELAHTFLCSDTLVDSVSQAASVSVHKYTDYSKRFPCRTKGLHLTARHGLLHLTQKLLVRKSADCNVEVDSKDGHGRKPLSYAASGGHEAIVKLLIDAGADVNAQGEAEFGNALQTASGSGHEHIVKLLVDSGADVNAQGGKYGYALHAASMCGHEQIVKLLVDSGADINAQDWMYGSALCAASACDHEHIVKLLVDSGADVNAQGGRNGNALHVASCHGYEQIVKLLVDNGADINAEINFRNHPSAQDWGFPRALSVASKHGHEQIVKLLVDSGADINAQGIFYGNALSAASEGCHEHIVKLLVDSGADVNAQGGRYGNDALSVASGRGYAHIVQLLVDSGADVNAERRFHCEVQERFYGNALSAASGCGHEQIVKLLVDSGAEVNAKGGFYGNALSAASDGGHEHIVKLLVDSGADVNAHGEGVRQRVPGHLRRWLRIGFN